MSPASVQARDRALRRLRSVNRLVIGGSVVLTGLFSDVAANAFSGHSHKTGATAVPATTGATTGSNAGSSQSGTGATAGSSQAAPATSSTHHRSRHHRLQPPAQAPSPETATAPAPTAAPQPVPAAPAPQPVAPIVVAPAPVVSGGS